MRKRLEVLENELEELRESNKSSWDMWGSELCAGDMIGKERALEDQIKKLKEEIKDEEIIL